MRVMTLINVLSANIVFWRTAVVCSMHIAVRALSVWHILILSLLITVVVLGLYGVLIYPDFRIAFGFYLFYGSLMATLIYTLLTSTLLIRENEVRFGWWHIGSVKIEKVRLRFDGWIVDLGKYNCFIVLDRDKLIAYLAKLMMGETVKKRFK